MCNDSGAYTPADKSQEKTKIWQKAMEWLERSLFLWKGKKKFK
jgi:hypothetical protein